MTFTKGMRKILQSGEWLSDLHMSLAHEILQYQFPRIGGWQSTLLVQIHGFVPVQNEAIQILLVSGNHWVTSSDVGQVDSKFKGSHLPSSYTYQLCQIYKTLIKINKDEVESAGKLVVNITPVQQQSGSSDWHFCYSFCAAQCI